MTCPDCEYHKQRAQLWRNEAYKHSGHPLDWEPDLMIRPKPLTAEEIEKAYRHIWRSLPDDFDHTTASWIEQGIRYAERAHEIGEKE